nr:signal peptidase II [Clostridia bacterium]
MSKKTWTSIFALVAVEQIIKIIIYNHFFERRFPILAPILYFEPMFNKHYSWFNSMFRLGIGKGIHIAFVLIIVVLIYLFYRYLNDRVGTNKMINAMFAFLFSGATCSLIDKIFWDGSLDYILLKGFFTFDLKDVYINIFNGLLIFSLVSDNKAIKQLEDKEILKNFIRYILRKS